MTTKANQQLSMDKIYRDCEDSSSEPEENPTYRRKVLSKEISSTRYSEGTRSKLLQNNDNDSASDQSSQKGNCRGKRREQNRQSAKKCRIKKKERFLELEVREKWLVEQSARLQSECMKAKYDLDKFMTSTNSPSMFGNTTRSQSYDRLSKILETDDAIDQDQINMVLDNLRLRVGAIGTERQSKVNYVFKQIIHISFPALHRYLMWTADHQSDYFGQNQCPAGGWMKALKAVLNLTPQQQSIIIGKKQIFREQYQTFSELIGQLKTTKTSLQKQSSRLQGLIEQLRKMLTPIQCCRMITFIENNKCKSEMELWVQRNMRKFSEEAEPPVDPGCCKKPKLED